MMVTNPANIPTIGLIIPFVILFFAVTLTVRLVVGVIQKPHSRMINSPFVAGVVAVVFVALQSIGQLTSRDIIAVALIVAVGSFYIKRNRMQGNK